MNRRAMSTLRSLLSAALALTLLACSQGHSSTQPPLSQAPLAGAAIGGDFALTGSDGRTVRWSDFAGQWRVVYFGFTYCPDICPTDVQRTAQGLNQFAQQAPELAANIQPIFITIDPERDTPEAVGQFASAFSDDLIGLTGTPEQIADAADKFGVYYRRGATAANGSYLMDHTNITYLFDPDGNPIAMLPTDQGAEAVAAELATWVR